MSIFRRRKTDVPPDGLPTAEGPPGIAVLPFAAFAAARGATPDQADRAWEWMRSQMASGRKPSDVYRMFDEALGHGVE